MKIEINKAPNLLTNGFVKTSGSDGTLSVDTNTYYKSADSPAFGTVTTTGNIELGNASDTTLSRSAAGVLAVEGVVVPTVSSTNTLTNKAITPRITSITSALSITPNADTTDIYEITALVDDPTINAPTGTPVNGQKLTFKISDSPAGAFALTWNAAYVSAGAQLPAWSATDGATTKLLTVEFVYNTANSLNKWMCTSVSVQDANIMRTDTVDSITGAKTFVNSITGSYLTPSEILITDASKNIVSAPVATYPSLTELSYVKGVTSAIQTQLNAKGVGDMTLSGVQSVTGAKTFDKDKILMKGTSTGTTTISTANTSSTSYTQTLQAKNGTIANSDDTTYIGTTAVALNRGSGALSLAGVTTDGNLPLTGGTMTGTITLGENTSIALDPAGSADGKYSGITITGTGGAVIAFGDLVQLSPADSRWELVDISAAAGAVGDARGIMGIAVTSSTDGGALTVLLNGQIRADANFPALTVGAPVYASTTGDIVVTQPTTTDHVIRVVGFALTADEIYFNPSQDYITHV